MIDYRRKLELELIDAAVSAGKVRRFPLGATTDFDSKPFRERRVMLYRGKDRNRYNTEEDNISN